MANISVSLPSDGETVDASDYNTPINQIVNDYNGNIDNSNIATAAAIAGSKLADSSVTGAKISTYKLPYQTKKNNVVANTTGTTVVLQAGWGQVIGNGASALSSPVTFPTTFTTLLGISVTLLGFTGATSTPASDITGLSGTFGTGGVTIQVGSMSTSGFTATFSQGETFNNARYYGFTWTAWGI